MAKTPLGRLDPRAFGMLELPRLDKAILDGFRALGDLTGTTSDALDECRITGVVPGSTLRPTDTKARLVGQAITVLNQRREAGEMKKSGLGEIEAHHLAEAGDVLVIQGIAGVSSMGGVSASVGRRQGEAGAIVDGAVRDIDHSRKIGYPVWCSSVSPITGKWRIQTVAINRPVSICGVSVSPGDLVIADEVGVCFVPCERAAEVLAVAQRLTKREDERLAKLDSGMPLKDWIKL
jgi:4-hydroxy-4-methyl-2-oxoglutarate aldolase